MPTRLQKLPLSDTSGVYRIRCITSGRCYVGSAMSIRKRVHTHRLDLSAGRHENPYLQNAWDKYGSGAFAFEIIAEVGVGEMLSVEQRHIDECGLWPKGYNVNPVAAKPPASYRPQTYHGYVSPIGERVVVTDLKAFCAARNLNVPRMFDVRIGKTRHHHGWTWRGSGYSRRQRSDGRRYPGFVSPEGVRLTIVNMKAFCRERELDGPSMLRTARGGSRHHKGWTYQPATED